MDDYRLWEIGYYNYWFPYKFNNDNYLADAEFGTQDELVSIVLYETDEYGSATEMIKEILPENLKKQFIHKITNEWKKQRRANNGRL